jgi:hypothetical protein
MPPSAPSTSLLPITVFPAGLIYLIELDHSDKQPPGILTVGGSATGDMTDTTPTATFAPLPADLSRFATEDITFPPGDSMRPNVWYDGRVDSAGNFSRSVVLTAVDGPSYSQSFGTVLLANGDGALDVLPDISAFVNSRCTILYGQRGAAYSTYKVLATGVVQGVDVSLDQAELYLGGIESALEKAWSDRTYRGNGGLEGPNGLSGVRKPVVIGRVFNINPVLIEPLTYIFQCHAAGPLAAVSKVSFGGVAMLPTSDYATYADLLAASVSIGYYATCLSSGLVKAGLTAAGVDGSFVLTVDCEQALFTADTLALSVAQAAVANLGTEIDLPAFADMATLDGSFNYGRFLTEPATYADVLTDLMRNMNRYWGISRSGLLTTARLDQAPDSLSSTLVWDETDILAIDRMALPDGFQWPHASRVVRYFKNWSVQQNLAAIVTSPAYGREYKERRGVASFSRNSLEPPAIDTNLMSGASVDLMTSRLLSLHGQQRAMYSVKVSILSGIPSLLESVSVTYPRFGLQAGKPCVVVASSEDYDDGTALLTLWR